MKQICVAVVGCGRIANIAHLPNLAKNKNVRIKYCVDLIEERAKLAKEKYNVEQYLVDYTQMLKDTEIEAVFVLTPNFSHSVIAMDCLNMGKNVFCEKPITVNYTLSKEMANCAKLNKKILDIGVCNRYNTSVNHIKNYILSGKLGDVYHVYCSFRSYRSIPGLGGDFTTNAISGGGVLIDWGIHFLDLILYSLNLPKIKSVTANAYCKLGKEISNYIYSDMWAGPPNLAGNYDVDDFVSGYIRTSSASISFNGAWAQNINQEEMYIDFIGDKAGIRLQYGANFELYSTENGMLQTIKPTFTMVNHYEAEQLGFFDSIKNETKSRNNIENVIESAKILDAIYESSLLNKEIIF